MKTTNDVGQSESVAIGVQNKTDYEIEVAKNRVIIRFEESTTETERQKARETFGVTSHEICKCGDTYLELWGLNKPIDVTAYDAVDALIRDAGVPKSEGEPHFTFKPPVIEDYDPEKCASSSFDNIGVNNDNAVNIAVLDTGLDSSYFGDKRFLYDTSEFGECGGHAGWSFTGEGSHDISDRNGHGTFVTKIIASYLDEKDISYRILPLKVLNKDAKGSFWNMLCALSYLQRIQKEGARIDLVNLSLGGLAETKFFNANDFMGQTIQSMKDTTLFITSAGNGGHDTDSKEYRHFPSGYAGPNILSVGGYKKSVFGNVLIHENSNYGKHSIDVAAQYSGYHIRTNESSLKELPGGTSYAAAYVTAIAAEYFANHQHRSPNDIKRGIVRASSEQSFLRDKFKEVGAIL